jgi:hypothetical protein
MRNVYISGERVPALRVELKIFQVILDFRPEWSGSRRRLATERERGM